MEHIPFAAAVAAETNIYLLSDTYFTVTRYQFL
jgi:hypothetical protein